MGYECNMAVDVCTYRHDLTVESPPNQQLGPCQRSESAAREVDGCIRRSEDIEILIMCERTYVCVAGGHKKE